MFSGGEEKGRGSRCLCVCVSGKFCFTQMSKEMKLRSGLVMPTIGLGTWKSERGKAGDAVRTAIRAGYRLIDCANDYGNEDEVGEAIAEMIDEGVVKREELFIQAKLWNTNHRKAHVRVDLEATLKDLKVDYLDSFVIHWPQACPATGVSAALRTNGNTAMPKSHHTMFPVEDNGLYSSDNECHYMEAYHAMEDLVDEGLCKSIGLSNFNIRQIHEVLSNAKKHLPAVLQNECHPYLQQKDILDVCKINDIVFQSFSPLGSGDSPFRTPGQAKLLDDPKLKDIADKHGKSVAQVVLRWHVQRGSSAVPKSVTPSRIEENIDVFDFDLSAEDLASFDRLNIGKRFLTWFQCSMHPDFPFKDEVPFGYVIEPAPTNTHVSTK